MPIPKVTPQRYQLFVDAFMTMGPRFAMVGRRLNCSPASAKQVWEKGFPTVDYAPPVREIYDASVKRVEDKIRQIKGPETQGVASSAPGSGSDALNERKTSVTEMLSDSALEVIGTEMDLLQAQRLDVLGATTVANKIIRGFDSLAEAVLTNMQFQASNPMQVNPKAFTAMMLDFSRAMVNLAAATETIMKNQRLLWGAPGQITEVREKLAPGTDAPTDAQERMERAANMVDMLRRANLLPGQGVPTDTIEAYEGEESGAAELLPPAKKAS